MTLDGIILNEDFNFQVIESKIKRGDIVKFPDGNNYECIATN